ncbi:MAG: AhpC/TSA family protein [Acidimicrobiales bacterium]
MRELGGDLVVFFAAAPGIVEQWFAQSGYDPDLTVIADPDASLYEALGAKRASAFALARAGVRSTVTAWRAGYRPKYVGADVFRLGADVVVDADGEMTFLHPARDPADRIPPDELVEELAEAAAPN